MDNRNILQQYHQKLQLHAAQNEIVIIPVMFSTRFPIIRSISALDEPPPPPEPNPLGRVIIDYTNSESF